MAKKRTAKKNDWRGAGRVLANPHNVRLSKRAKARRPANKSVGHQVKTGAKNVAAYQLGKATGRAAMAYGYRTGMRKAMRRIPDSRALKAGHIIDVTHRVKGK